MSLFLNRAVQKTLTEWLTTHPEALELAPEERRLREEQGGFPELTLEEQIVNAVCHQMEYCRARVIDDAPRVTVEALLGPFYNHLEVMSLVERAVAAEFALRQQQLIAAATRASASLRAESACPRELILTDHWFALTGLYFLGLRTNLGHTNCVMGDCHYADMDLSED